MCKKSYTKSSRHILGNRKIGQNVTLYALKVAQTSINLVTLGLGKRPAIASVKQKCDRMAKLLVQCLAILEICTNA